MPTSLIEHVHATTTQLYQQLATKVEPFKLVDAQWLARFLQQLEAENGGFSSKILTLSWLDKGERIPYNG